MARLALRVLICVVLCVCGQVSAQEVPDRPVTDGFEALLVSRDVPEPQRRILEAALTGAGHQLVPVSEELAVEGLRGGALDRDAIAPLSEVERLLDEVRAYRLSLRDSLALNALARAKEILLEHPALPGASQWLAEVETTHGIMAAQRGELRVSEHALRRSLVLDPSRTVRLGEAPPRIVALSSRLQQELRDAPSASVWVEVQGVEGARVFVDDLAAGVAPVQVRAKSGRHIFRVEAPGYVSYGWAEDLAVGEQPPLQITLEEHPNLRRARLLRTAVDQRQIAQLPAVLDDPSGDDTALGVVWWSAHDPLTGKWLLGWCSRRGCVPPERLAVLSSQSLGEAVGMLSFSVESSVGPSHRTARSSAIAAAYRWLGEPPVGPAPSQDTEDAWVWGGLGAGIAVALGVTLTAIAIASEDDTQSLRIQIDPCAVTGCP